MVPAPGSQASSRGEVLERESNHKLSKETGFRRVGFPVPVLRGWRWNGRASAGVEGSTRLSPLWPKAEKRVEMLEKAEKGSGVGVRRARKERFRGGGDSPPPSGKG